MCAHMHTFTRARLTHAHTCTLTHPHTCIQVHTLHTRFLSASAELGSESVVRRELNTRKAGGGRARESPRQGTELDPLAAEMSHSSGSSEVACPRLPRRCAGLGRQEVALPCGTRPWASPAGTQRTLSPASRGFWCTWLLLPHHLLTARPRAARQVHVGRERAGQVGIGGTALGGRGQRPGSPGRDHEGMQSLKGASTRPNQQPQEGSLAGNSRKDKCGVRRASLSSR